MLTLLLHNNNIEMQLTRLFQSGCKARGTTTNRVTRYSESITKCSFLTEEMDSACHPGKILCCVSLLDKKIFVVSAYLTRSATFLVTRLPVCFFSMLCSVFFLLEECRPFIQNSKSTTELHRQLLNWKICTNLTR